MSQNKSSIVCGNYDSAYNICKCMFKNGPKPSRAKATKVDAPGALEGPSIQVDGLICTVTSNPTAQEGCTGYTKRDPDQDKKDWDL